MFLFLRYNRVAQILLAVIAIGLIGGGSFYFFSNKSEKANNIKPSATQSSPSVDGSTQPVARPSVPANVTLPENKNGIGALTWTGDLKSFDLPLPDSRAVVPTDPKTDFVWPTPGRNLNIRRTNTPITTYYVAIIHKESVSQLIKIYTEIIEAKGFKLQSSVMNSDLEGTKKTEDATKAANVFLVFTKGTEQLTAAIQSPLNVGDRVLPSIVEININKLGSGAPNGTQPANGAQPNVNGVTPTPGVSTTATLAPTK